MEKDMLFPLETDYLTWANKYDIRVESGECSKCGNSVITNLPFAFEGYRGLKSEDHGCGEKYTWKTFVPVGEDEKSTWKNIASSM